MFFFFLHFVPNGGEGKKKEERKMKRYIDTKAVDNTHFIGFYQAKIMIVDSFHIRKISHAGFSAIS